VNHKNRATGTDYACGFLCHSVFRCADLLTSWLSHSRI